MDLIGTTIAALPMPPLPLMVNRTDKTGKQVAGYANTHHVLQQAVVHAMRRDCKKENMVRQVKQVQLTNVFMVTFRDPSQTPEVLYREATSFTRQYLHSFMPDRSVPDARFAPYDEIHTSTYYNNPLVRSSCEHLAGLMYYNEAGVRSYDEVLVDLKTLPFSTLLTKYRDVHIARGVEEENDKIHQIVELAE